MRRSVRPNLCLSRRQHEKLEAQGTPNGNALQSVSSNLSLSSISKLISFIFLRFFFGKNKVMSIGLGRTEAEEYKEGLHKLAACLTGQCGLLFTNSSREEISKFFAAYRQKDYARTGDIASETVVLEAGPLTQFPHNIEPYLRELGMPTALQKGVVTLLQDFQVCKKGAELTSEQARILKLLEKKLARFALKIDAMWSAGEGFELLKKEVQGSDGEEEEEEEVEEEEMSDDEE